MEIVEGWALPDEFTRENVIVLLQNYPRAFDSIGMAYTKELMGIREKTEAGRRSVVHAGADSRGAERFGLTPEDVEEEVGILPSVWKSFTISLPRQPSGASARAGDRP